MDSRFFPAVAGAVLLASAMLVSCSGGDNKLTGKEKKEGWTLLFNGENPWTGGGTTTVRSSLSRGMWWTGASRQRGPEAMPAVI